MLLARISHQPSAAVADPLAVAGRTPSRRFDVVTTTPAASFSPCDPPQRRLDALATNAGEKCGLVTRRALALRLLPALAGLLAGGCASNRPVRLPGSFDAAGRDPDGAGLRIRLANGRVANLKMDDYVSGAVLAEAALRGLDPQTAAAVAEVQAIVSRTYALANRQRHAHEGFDLCATTHCQVYRPVSSWPAPLAQMATSAAQSTSGAVITYAGRPINAVFHADCGGHTSAAATAWRGDSPPYLRGLPDGYCARDGSAPWRAEVSVSAVRRALNRDDATSIGRRLDAVEVTERDAAGRAVKVTLRGARTVAVRGEQLRSAINAGLGEHAIRSTRFNVRRSGRALLFEGRGFGHGVGLCQTGTMARARSGHSPLDIIAHYYPGTAVSNIHALPKKITSLLHRLT